MSNVINMMNGYIRWQIKKFCRFHVKRRMQETWKTNFCSLKKITMFTALFEAGK